jgi:nickel/cobalt transporter (NiCoT) family protein
LSHRLGFSRAEGTRVSAFYATIGLLHLGGWGLFLYYSSRHPSLAGLGFVAYMLGLRHAFDADHIAAIDDTVRNLLQKGRRPLGVGFFFSLGHSTVVFAVAVALVFATAAIRRILPALQNVGGIVAAGISGGFLWLIGILNLIVLLQVLKTCGRTRAASHDHPHVGALLAQGGLLNRLFGGRVRRIVKHSWQMYPVGVLFGLGFDTASEVGLLVVTAAASTADLPVAAVLSLPILFAAGMSALDTTDGVVMVKAYSWALVDPARRILYNVTITSLSVAVALVIGTIELLQVVIGIRHPSGRFFSFVAGLDLGVLGYVIVGLFLFGWSATVLLWKFAGFGERHRARAQT